VERKSPANIWLAPEETIVDTAPTAETADTTNEAEETGEEKILSIY
jgi:hypothetical protein